MELQKVLEACNDALRMNEYTIKVLREDNASLREEIKGLEEKIERLETYLDSVQGGEKK